MAASFFSGVPKVSANSCLGPAHCWQQYSVTAVGSGNNQLNSVYAVSTKDIWAVGYYNDGSHDDTLVEHGVLSGSDYSWSHVTSPNQSGYNNYLKGVAFARNDLNAKDVWAVGYYTNTGSSARTLIEQYHNGSWSTASSPNQGSGNNLLNGVAGSSASNYWAAGYYFNGTVNQTLAEFWNGSSWQISLPPNHGTSDNNYLTSVSVISTTDIWFGGFYVDSSSVVTYPMMLRFHNSSWSSYYPGDTGRRVDGISMLSSSSGWADGWQPGGYLAYTWYWDGSNWSGGNAQIGDFHAVDYNSTNSAWGVGGVIHFGAPDTTYAGHWDGTSWSDTNSVSPSSDCSLLGVSAPATTDVWAVGYYKDSTTNLYAPLVEHYN